MKSSRSQLEVWDQATLLAHGLPVLVRGSGSLSTLLPLRCLSTPLRCEQVLHPGPVLPLDHTNATLLLRLPGRGGEGGGEGGVGGEGGGGEAFPLPLPPAVAPFCCSGRAAAPSH